MRNIDGLRRSLAGTLARAVWGFVTCLVTFGCGGETGKEQTCADCTGQPSSQTGGTSSVTGGSQAGTSQTTQGSGGSPGDTTVQSGLTACSWPAVLNGSSRDQCHASRRMIACTDPGGGGEFCTTDGGATCFGTPGQTCKDRCAPDEYFAACGGVGPGAVPDPPVGCHSGSFSPAGIAYYCCPCGS
jgi:hypothetical protein